MEQKILSVLPANWNAYIVNGNTAPVTASLRKQIRKLNPRLNRIRRRNPVLVLFYFSAECKYIGLRQDTKKNRP